MKKIPFSFKNLVIFMFLLSRVKGYIIFIRKYVKGERKRFRFKNVYMFLIRETS